MGKKTDDKYSFQKILAKARAYCAYQERCQWEVLEKLHSWGIKGSDSEALIKNLISNNYLNEERFTKIYTGSKFRQKKWGRIKIRFELMQYKISDRYIERALDEISEDEYVETLIKLASGKLENIKNKDFTEAKPKIASYLMRKGYEAELVWEILNKSLINKFKAV